MAKDKDGKKSLKKKAAKAVEKAEKKLGKLRGRAAKLQGKLDEVKAEIAAIGGKEKYVSPFAQPFPDMPEVEGVRFAACEAGVRYKGRKDVMLAEAKDRIARAPGHYVPHVYGEKEAGGTSVFHLSAVPFGELGYEMGLPEKPMPDLTDKPMRFIPRIFLPLLAFFSLCAWVVRRRMHREGAEEHD